jgi:hypothetical protein
LLGLAPYRCDDTLPGIFVDTRLEDDVTLPWIRTLPGAQDTPEPKSGVRLKPEPIPGSPTCLRRPERLLDDIDAEKARRYRDEADQLIAAGIFEPAS